MSFFDYYTYRIYKIVKVANINSLGARFTSMMICGFFLMFNCISLFYLLLYNSVLSTSWFDSNLIGTIISILILGVFYVVFYSKERFSGIIEKYDKMNHRNHFVGTSLVIAYILFSCWHVYFVAVPGIQEIINN